jgi:hypothetical protein
MKAKLFRIRLHCCYLLSLVSNISLLTLYSETLNQRSFIGRPRHKWGDNIKGMFKEYRILVNWMEMVEKLGIL